jgi:hypothetical protein
MWFYHPIEDRPQLPILIALPLGFILNFLGLGYVAVQQQRYRKRSEEDQHANV